ncbi:MAG: hypothetical protein C4570_01315 [Ammonifex sp.]|jgi:hypothetical protein|nr:MAG: hypothetical protein C4570_01315 [Ammonifex sp.]
MVHETFPNLLWALMLQDFPESLIAVLFVFSILNFRFWDKRVLSISLLQTVTNLVRLLPIAFGIHTVILIISLVIYTCLFTGARPSRTFAAVLICFSVSAAVQVAYFMPLLQFTGLNYEVVFANPFLRAAFALPYEAILLLLALGKNCYNNRKGLVVN